ncbi:hypothetical protein [Acidicapsa ligni]|uniref:hypothetical protein n=1 Tax=Acidicapsa ligni TaxID=542300 RepID=UPI0021E06E99|nr:hypothetical protein [Acidicapsa ligni]
MRGKASPMNRAMAPLHATTVSNVESRLNLPWAMQIKAATTEQPSRILQMLTGAIVACGGWVLSRGTNDAGIINMLFEFERQHCVDVYTMLAAVGLELSQLAHLQITALCQCTRSHFEDCRAEIVSVDLEIHTFPAEIAATPRSASETA